MFFHVLLCDFASFYGFESLLHPNLKNPRKYSNTMYGPGEEYLYKTNVKSETSKDACPAEFILGLTC